MPFYLSNTRESVSYIAFSNGGNRIPKLKIRNNPGMVSNKAIFMWRSSTPFLILLNHLLVKMPLHLLHQKSWHVYNKDNIERVQRDKERARKKEEEEEMRMNAIDQERRLMKLRGNATGTPVVESTTSELPVTEQYEPPKGKRSKKKQGHVNLFEDVEKTAPVEENLERKIELAAEKKKWEDMFTSRLVNATKDHNPWYSQLDKISGQEKEMSEIEKEVNEKKQEKWKENADPLKVMEKFLARKREVDEREERRRDKMERELTERERRSGRARTPEKERRHGSSHERDKRHEKERRHRKRERSRSRSPKREHRRHHKRRHRDRHHSPDLEKLRAERAEREAAETEKIKKLMYERKEEDVYRPVGHAGYSAQFHPEAVRR